MDYEYKSILLDGDDSPLKDRHCTILNDYFKKGWEYVNSISQCITSHGSAYSKYYGSVIIILRKKNESIKL